jgi:transposase
VHRQRNVHLYIALHSDNGSPMKGETMLATMQRLGVAHSRSRPSVSNDNPYSESLFRTLKYRPQLPLEPFKDTVDEDAKARAQMMDGKLLLVSNVADLTPAQVVSRYKALADIERGFRILKSEIEIAPVYHRLPQRIRAQAQICFMALIVYRMMRQRLKLAKSELSPKKALAKLRRIQHHRVSVNAAAPIAGISTINTGQTEILAALSIKKPTIDTQLSLL